MADKQVREQESGGVGAVERTRSETVYLPDVDIVETRDQVVVIADMPGVDEASVNVTLENDVLSLEGTVSGPVPAGCRLDRCEYGRGTFARAFAISADVEAKGIQATMRHGVLRVVLPKTDAVKPRKIAVKAE